MNAAQRLVIFVGGILFLSDPLPVLALSSPSAADLQVFQGEEQVLEIPVQNDTVEPKTIVFSLSHVSFDDNGEPVLKTSAKDVSWVKILQTSTVFEPGEVRSVTVIVSPDDEVPSGSYVFALISAETQENAYALAHGTATLLFLTVGSVEPEANCVAFEKKDDGTFLLTLQNSGQGILYDEGSVILRGLFGIAYAAVSSNPSRHRIFTGQTRTWTSEPVTIPWWAVGPLAFSLESDHIASTCPRISAGFGWLPLMVFAAGGIGIIVVRRRM